MSNKFLGNPYRVLTIPIATAVSQTRASAFFAALGFAFEVVKATLYTRSLAGAVSVDPQRVAASYDGPLSSPALLIDAVPEKIKVGAHAGFIDGVSFLKAAETAIVFSAAHVVTALKYGIILVQETSAGVVSTKVPAATPTTAMAYDSASAALSALPAPDAGNIAVGYILINANGANWDGNTDDLTDGSDVTTAVFTSLTPTPDQAASLFASAAAFVAGTPTDATLATDGSKLRFGPTDLLNIPFTSDGTGALTNGHLVLTVKAL